MGIVRRSFSSGKLPSLRLSRGAPRSPTSMKSTPISSTVEAADDDDIEDHSQLDMSSATDEGGKQQVLGRKIMIVVDSSRESKVALQWALSHTAQSQDTILLLNVLKPSSDNININPSHGAIDGEEGIDPRNYHLLCAMKRISQQKKPEVKVEICLVEGKEKAAVIVEAAKRQGAALLVLGSKKRRPMMVMMWRLLMPWRRGSRGGGSSSSRAVVDYCIKNASCMAVGVRRRGRRAGGGYLITTRKHKDFWLLA